MCIRDILSSTPSLKAYAIGHRCVWLCKGRIPLSLECKMLYESMRHPTENKDTEYKS